MTINRIKATLDEVAARAGVSKATASKVLNDRPGIADQTRQRVRDAIRDLNYSPSTGQRSTGAKRHLHLVFDSLSSSYSLYILDGVIAGVHSHGFEVITDVISPGGVVPTTSIGLERIRSIASTAAGLIVVTTHLTTEELAEAERLNLPVVVVDPVDPLDERVPSVGATNWAGGVQATQHLIDLGHRHIAFAGGPEFSLPSRERLAGCREALERAGLELPAEFITFGDSYSSESGAGSAKQILSAQVRPTAVFAASDVIALGVIRVARRLGLSVPEDLSVVGFDDTYGALWTDPPLTSVRQPLREMGQVAARTLLGIAQGQEPDSHHVQLSTTLVVRESTSALT